MARHVFWLRGAAQAAVLILTAAALAACDSTTAPPGVPVVDYQAAPRETIPVASRAASHVLYLRSGWVSRPEREQLTAFIINVGGDRPESLRATLRGRVNQTALRQVAQVLIDDGVAPRNIVRSSAPAPAGTVIVALERAVANSPACPGWFEHTSSPADNHIEPNLGCSDTANLAAMLGDPHDLTAAQSTIYHDGQRGSDAVTAYKTDKVKDLPKLKEDFEVIPSVGGSGR